MKRVWYIFNISIKKEKEKGDTFLSELNEKFISFLELLL